MDLARFWKHVRMTPATARACFPDATLDALQRAIAESERRHRGQVAFVVEAELSTAQLLRGLTSRERAREVFAVEGVWNTEENTGVLIYVLLAEHHVEIVADRGIDGRVEAGAWTAVCDAIDREFQAGRYREGAIAGVEAVSRLLAEHYPATGEQRNEIDDRPVMM